MDDKRNLEEKKNTNNSSSINDGGKSWNRTPHLTGVVEDTSKDTQEIKFGDTDKPIADNKSEDYSVKQEVSNNGIIFNYPYVIIRDFGGNRQYVLPEKSKVKILESLNDRYKISYEIPKVGTRIGYVSKDYCKRE